MNKTTEIIFSAIGGAIVGFTLNIFSYIGPDINSIKNDIDSINYFTNTIDYKLEIIESKYLKVDNDGRECIVGYSKDVSNNNVSVYVNNKYNLKRGDRIELTYLYGSRKVSIECFVHFVDKAENNSDADFFISTENLDIFQISKKEHKRGVFDMRFKIITN